MRYLSVCSGVEAATTAWHNLGWTPVGFSEIEKFPSEVLAHHYPSVPNLGDMTKYKEWNLDSVRLLVGGTPCQSFSVAGLRKGLEDPRGNLALTYVGILDKFRPKWCIWENVPGVLSSNGGRDFGSFLGALAELGYGFAYRVLDAQYFGVPQRRRRVFVVGCLGDWEAPAKVLLEREGLLRNPAPSRKTGKEVTGFAPSSFGNYGEGVGTLRRDGGDLGGGSETLVTTNRMVAFGEYSDDGTASTLKARDYKDATDLIVYETHPADSRVKEMGDVCQTVTSRWGTGGGNVPIAIQDVSGRKKAQNGRGWNDEGVMYTLDAAATQGVAYSIREDAKANNFSATPLEVTPALQALRPSVQSHHAQTFIAQSFNVNARPDEMKLEVEVSGTLTASQNSGLFKDRAVRRLTPTECERLQGFPDNYTNIPWRGKPDSPDAPRYKAMGNSMAVPVMKWIGNRIQEFEDGLL
jgi:DNA (cytosine-5)-methyltransferase 1